MIKIFQKRQIYIIKEMVDLKTRLNMHNCKLCKIKPELSFIPEKDTYLSSCIERKLYISSMNYKILEKLSCPFPFIYFRFNALSYKWWMLEIDIETYRKI